MPEKNKGMDTIRTKHSEGDAPNLPPRIQPSATQSGNAMESISPTLAIRPSRSMPPSLELSAAAAAPATVSAFLLLQLDLGCASLQIQPATPVTWWRILNSSNCDGKLRASHFLMLELDFKSRRLKAFAGVVAGRVRKDCILLRLASIVCGMRRVHEERRNWSGRIREHCAIYTTSGQAQHNTPHPCINTTRYTGLWAGPNSVNTWS
ncbi:hypothetical protein ACLOJK_039332 [Asimina triloba]